MKKENKSWTSDEIEALVELRKRGIQVKKIAYMLGRSVRSVKGKLYGLRGSSVFSKFIKIADDACKLTDAEMVALLREHGWTVTCIKTQTVKL